MTLLVCEGQCSPVTAEYDRAAYDYALSLAKRTDEGSRTLYNLKRPKGDDVDRVAELGHRLVHTEHQQIGMNTWKCIECGSLRMY